MRSVCSRSPVFEPGGKPASSKYGGHSELAGKLRVFGGVPDGTGHGKGDSVLPGLTTTGVAGRQVDVLDETYTPVTRVA